MNQNLYLKSSVKIILCLLLFCGSLASISYAQVTLTNQAAVDKYEGGSTINGSLNIGGVSTLSMSDIESLEALASVTHVSGDLTITFNSLISNLNGLENLKSVGGNIFITGNARLGNCLSIFSLLSDLATIGGIIIIDNNAGGCNSQSDVVNHYNSCGNPGNKEDSDGDGVIDCKDNCPLDNRKTSPGDCGCGNSGELDTDGDGVIDCQDDCPLDGNKTSPGNCGCGISGEQDTDGDGVPSCQDGCPFDKNKTSPGNCGCGVIETPDSDGDGVSDCKDECPNNPNRQIKGACGCETPEIELVEIEAESACQSQGTYTPNDDQFSASVHVHFEYPPQLGAILIRGGVADYRFDFSNENYTQTQFDFRLNFWATGDKTPVIVEYIGEEACFYAQNNFISPMPCSGEVCEVPTNLGAEIVGNQVTLNWATVPMGTTYEYQYRAANTDEWHKQWTDQTSAIICDLAVDQDYEYRLRSYCENALKSDYTTGVFTTAATPITCEETEVGEEQCSIQNIEILKIRECHDRGTINQDDDYFIADVLVAFSNPPGVGTLTLTGNAEETISFGQLQYLNIYRFSKIKLIEKDEQIELTATFSGNTDCQYTISYPIPANPCWSGGQRLGLIENQGGYKDSEGTGSKANFLSVGPNPAQDALSLRYEFPAHLQGDLGLSIYNIYGQTEITKVLDKASQQSEIDISTLKNGVHYLVLNVGGLRISKKIVKEDGK